MQKILMLEVRPYSCGRAEFAGKLLPAMLLEFGGLVADTFESFATLLERHLIEKTLENEGLVSAFDYRTALDDPDTKKILVERVEGTTLYVTLCLVGMKRVSRN